MVRGRAVVSERDQKILGIMCPKFRDSRINMAHAARRQDDPEPDRGLLAPAFASDALDELPTPGRDRRRRARRHH